MCVRECKETVNFVERERELIILSLQVKTLLLISLETSTLLKWQTLRTLMRILVDIAARYSLVCWWVESHVTPGMMLSNSEQIHKLFLQILHYRVQ